MAQDIIKITGIKTFGYHGVFENEKKTNEQIQNDLKEQFALNLNSQQELYSKQIQDKEERIKKLEGVLLERMN